MADRFDAVRLQRGVLTASAGNFGQGLAFAARAMGVPATVVVPDGAAETKVTALVELGAKVIRRSFDEWWIVLTSRACPGEDGIFVHPVAEPGVLAGNATIGAEILEELPGCDAVVVPFGGGGLICGIGSVMRRLKLRYPRASSFLAARFTRGGYLGLHLTIGFLIRAAGLWISR